MKIISSGGGREAAGEDIADTEAPEVTAESGNSSGLPSMSKLDISHVKPIEIGPQAPEQQLLSQLFSQPAIQTSAAAPIIQPQQQPQPQVQPQPHPQPQPQPPTQPQPAVQQPQPQPHPPAQPQPQLPKPEISYPDETYLTKEQERALNIAIASKPAGPGLAAQKNDGQGFAHLAQPKKSAVKIIFVTLLVLALAGTAGFGGWYFWWTNYATFEYTLQSVVILDGQSVQPGDFLSGDEINKGITAAFRDVAFIPVPGPVVVPLRLELGLRSLETVASLYVLTYETERTHELGSETYDLVPGDFITNSQIARNTPYELIFTEPPLPLDQYAVGEHTLKLSLNAAPFEVKLIITDTTAPSATPEDVPVRIGEFVTAEQFVSNVSDHSGVATVKFAGEYEGAAAIQAITDKIVEVEISDIYGNAETYAGSLIVIKNQIPPEFTYVPRIIESMAGRQVPYPLDVAAFDDFGREIEYLIDDLDVDIDTVGEYLVLYVAEDFTGLVTNKVVTVFIIDADPDEVDLWIDNKLAEIISDDMTQSEKARAIWGAVRETISPETDLETEWTGSLYAAAHWAINNPKGDYYHFSALSELMLTRAGIENMRIERSELIDEPHFWNLIYIDDEGWFHYDAMQATNWNAYAWMDETAHKFTQTQADQFSKQIADHPDIKQKGYYDFEKARYPDIVRELGDNAP